MFPVGPQDDYKYISSVVFANQEDEIERLFASGTTSFNMINALLDGVAYPALEQLTGGKSFVEMTVACWLKRFLRIWHGYPNRGSFCGDSISGA